MKTLLDLRIFLQACNHMKAFARLLSGKLNAASAEPVGNADKGSRPSCGDAEENVLRNKFDRDTAGSTEENRHGKHVSGGKVKTDCSKLFLLISYIEAAQSQGLISRDLSPHVVS